MHKNVNVEVLIEPDDDDTSPGDTHTTKAKATITMEVKNKNSCYDYSVSVKTVSLCDYEDEEPLNLNEPVTVKHVPYKDDTVAIAVKLGELRQSLEMCKARKLELEFKVMLHLKRIYNISEICIQPYGLYDVIHFQCQ